jgi:peptide deformylase
MYDAEGIDAVRHAGRCERLLVIDVSETRDQPLVATNPEIVWASPTLHRRRRGCLSVPGIYDGVERSLAKVRHWTWMASARCMRPRACGGLHQHEMDHLMGRNLSVPVAPQSATASRPNWSNGKDETRRGALTW